MKRFFHLYRKGFYFFLAGLFVLAANYVALGLLGYFGNFVLLDSQGLTPSWATQEVCLAALGVWTLVVLFPSWYVFRDRPLPLAWKLVLWLAVLAFGSGFSWLFFSWGLDLGGRPAVYFDRWGYRLVDLDKWWNLHHERVHLLSQELHRLGASFDRTAYEVGRYTLECGFPGQLTGEELEAKSLEILKQWLDEKTYLENLQSQNRRWWIRRVAIGVTIIAVVGLGIWLFSGGPTPKGPTGDGDMPIPRNNIDLGAKGDDLHGLDPRVYYSVNEDGTVNSPRDMSHDSYLGSDTSSSLEEEDLKFLEIDPATYAQDRAERAAGRAAARAAYRAARAAEDSAEDSAEEFGRGVLALDPPSYLTMDPIAQALMRDSTQAARRLARAASENL